MIISGANLKVQYCIDLINKNKLKTFSKREYIKALEKYKYNIKSNYIKLVEV